MATFPGPLAVFGAICRGTRRSLSFCPLALVCLAVLLTGTPAAAASYFVRMDGRDTNSGLTNSADGAWKTLKHAFSRLEAGDTLSVADGTYSEYNLTLAFSGGSKSLRTTIRSVNKWGAKIVLDAEYHGLPIAADGVIIDGFEITWAPNPTKDHKGIEIYGNHTTVRNCHVHGIPFSGISGAFCDNVLIENNIVHDNYTAHGPENGSGISIWEPHMKEENVGGYNITIRNNVVYHNWATAIVASVGFPSDGNGIIIDDFKNSQTDGEPYLYKTLVENNLVFNNGGAGIHVFLSDNVTVRNNTVWYNNWNLNKYANSAQINNVGGSNNEFYNNIAVVAPAHSSKTAAMACKGDEGGITKYNNNILCGGWTRFDTWNSTTTLTSGTNSGNVTSADVGYPQFENPTSSQGFDFRLRSSSPVIDVGYGANAAAADLDGVRRPVGAAVDPGCYEHHVRNPGVLDASAPNDAAVPSDAAVPDDVAPSPSDAGSAGSTTDDAGGLPLDREDMQPSSGGCGCAHRSNTNGIGFLSAVLALVCGSVLRRRARRG